MRVKAQLPVVAAVLALGLGACSGDDSSNDAGSVGTARPSVPATAVAATADPSTAVGTTESTRPRESTRPTESTGATPTTAAETTAGPATTQDATTPPSTVDPNAEAIGRLAAFQARADRVGLDLFAPLSPAYIYYEGEVLLGEHGKPQPPATAIPIEGGFRLEQAGGSVTLDGFVFDDRGLIVDLNRNGVPVSTIVVGLGYTVAAGDLTGTVHSVRSFDGDLQVLMVTQNNSTTNSSFYIDSYVVDGRQLPVPPPTFFNNQRNLIRPGVTAAYVYLVEDAPYGGILYGQLGGGDGADSKRAEVEVAVPRPA